MLKNIFRAALACALALPPATGALGYEAVCFDLRRAGYIAKFKWALATRDNRNGLDTYWNGRNEREGYARFDPNLAASRRERGDAGSWGGSTIHAHQKGCFDLAAIAGPGDRVRFYVEAVSGTTVECQPSGGPGASQDDEGFPGFWLIPDGPPRGVLTFGADTGTVLHHWCARWSGELRMHSECNTGVNSMSNLGCAPFAPRITPTVLHEIVDQGGGLGMLGSVLRRRGDVNRHSRAHNENTPLHIAAWRNRPEYARHLLRSGANLNSRNRQGSTPVIIAAYYGNNEPLRMLLDAGANPSYPNELGDFPLHIAAERGDLEAARMLAEAGAQIDARHAAKNNESALAAAKREGHDQVAAFLRGVGAREELYDFIVYDIVNEDHGAARLRDAVNRGANVNARDDQGRTALHLAARRNLSRYVSELLRAPNVDRDAQDNQGRTPLMSAMEANAAGDAVVRSFLTRGANANTAADGGDFPLYVAARNGRRDLVDALIFARGIDLSQRHTESGMTALGLARDLRGRTGDDAYDDVISSLTRRGAE